MAQAHVVPADAKVCATGIDGTSPFHPSHPITSANTSSQMVGTSTKHVPVLDGDDLPQSLAAARSVRIKSPTLSSPWLTASTPGAVSLKPSVSLAKVVASAWVSFDHPADWVWDHAVLPRASTPAIY